MGFDEGSCRFSADNGKDKLGFIAPGKTCPMYGLKDAVKNFTLTEKI